ncbi:MAG: hypothetical protein HOP29_18405 [Phycisphaerales bacterium]|nr:hypothetical protein [Phycisphaerales bacterium]
MQETAQEAFVRRWTLAADRFVSGGFHHPGAMRAAADAAGVCEQDLPDPMQRDPFAVCYAFGRLFPDAELAIADVNGLIRCIAGGLSYRREHITGLAWSAPTAVLAEHYADRVKELSIRAGLWSAADKWLDESRPLGDIVRTMLASAARVPHNDI